ncbi:MAG: citrate/2-methylcitrate synthase, partial [Pyrinomonadaceae bacterium]
MNKAKEEAASGTSPAPSGLEGVVATTSSIGDVDGVNGILIYEGYDIHDLVKYSTFEEIVFLLWNGRLPKSAELEALKSDITRSQHLPAAMTQMLQNFPVNANPMDVLRTAVSALAFYNEGATDLSREGQIRSATLLTAQIPVIVATFDRLRQGQKPVAPKPELSIASNFLYMLKGKLPS